MGLIWFFGYIVGMYVLVFGLSGAWESLTRHNISGMLYLPYVPYRYWFLCLPHSLHFITSSTEEEEWILGSGLA